MLVLDLKKKVWIRIAAWCLHRFLHRDSTFHVTRHHFYSFLFMLKILCFLIHISEIFHFLIKNLNSCQLSFQAPWYHIVFEVALIVLIFKIYVSQSFSPDKTVLTDKVSVSWNVSDYWWVSEIWCFCTCVGFFLVILPLEKVKLSPPFIANGP